MRTGEEGEVKGEEEIEEVGRCLKDKKVNQERRILIRKLEETRWFILNEEIDGVRGVYLFRQQRTLYKIYVDAGK